MAIFALKYIKKGEEITFDYQFETIGDPLPCRCGAEKCRKVYICVCVIDLNCFFFNSFFNFNFF